VFRYYENLGYEDIASAMETTTKAVERLLARSRQHLRAVLGNRDDFFHWSGGVKVISGPINKSKDAAAESQWMNDDGCCTHKTPAQGKAFSLVTIT